MRRIREESMLTGEAVELEIRPASPLVRMGARFIDTVVSLLAIFAVLLLSSDLISALSQSMTRVVVITTLVMLMFVIPWIVESSTRGSSLGKWAFGLRAVRDDGGVVTVRHCLVRALVGVIELWLSFGAAALVCALVSPRGKRLGDYAAGTMVVRLAVERPSAPVIMPAELNEWASSAIVLPLPADLQVEAQTFLRTNRAFTPAIRAQAGADLASRVMRCVQTPPPPGTDPERFIAAVLVIVRDREYHREVGRQNEAVHRWRASHASAFDIADQ